MAAFPSGKLTASGYRYQRRSNVLRTDMDSGPAKQALRASQDLLQFPVTYLFTKAEFQAFQTFVSVTIGVVGWFDWTEPVSGSTVQARILNGDISNAQPLNPNLADWVVQFTMEIVD